MRQIKLKLFPTTFSENIAAGIAAKYLNSGEIVVRDGIEIAISCLFAPLGAAIEGASREEVEERCEISRTLLETYISLALTRVQNPCLSPENINEIDSGEKPEINLSKETDSPINTNGFFTESDGELVGINFDDEEF